MGHGRLTGSDDEQSLRALHRAFALGCNFFDTAWERNLAASDGARLPPRLGEALKAHRWDRAPDATP